MQEVIHPGFGVAAFPSSNRPACAQSFALAGRSILVETANPHLQDLFSHYLAAWHIKSIEPSATEPRVTIAVANSDPPTAPTTLESFAVAEGGVCYTDATSYFFKTEGGVVQSTDNSATRVTIWFADPVRVEKSAATARVIFNATMAALRRCGLFELHAAGVVTQGGKGVLLIGPSGSGKSTLATQLAAADWRYLSDDTLLIYENSGQIEARALRRVFALTNQTVDTLAALELPAEAVESFDPFKKRFEPRTVFPQGFAETCAPARLFFSRVSDESTSQTLALSRTETLARLIRMCPWACYDTPVARGYLKVLSDLARQASGFELSLGRDLFGQPEKTSHYLLGYAE